MANIEVRSVEGLAGSVVPYAYAGKPPVALPHRPRSFDFTGSTPAEAGRLSLVLRATSPSAKPSTSSSACCKTLAEFGLTKSSVRVDQYYPVFEAVRAYQLARHGEFGDYIPPSTRC